MSRLHRALTSGQRGRAHNNAAGGELIVPRVADDLMVMLSRERDPRGRRRPVDAFRPDLSGSAQARCAPVRSIAVAATVGLSFVAHPDDRVDGQRPEHRGESSGPVAEVPSQLQADRAVADGPQPRGHGQAAVVADAAGRDHPLHHGVQDLVGRRPVGRSVGTPVTVTSVRMSSERLRVEAVPTRSVRSVADSPSRTGSRPGPTTKNSATGSSVMRNVG